MRILWIALLLLSSSAHGASQVEVRMPISVYYKADFESPISFTVDPGTIISVSDKSYGAFRKIKATVFGKSQMGYVAASDLSSQKAPAKKREWGAGGGFAYTRLTQGAKTFSTADQVNYTISSYTGQSFNPSLSFQWGQRNFWRLGGLYRSVVLDGTASTDIAASAKQDIHLEYTMLAAQAQMGWGLMTDYWYGGLGAEAAKSIGGSARLGNQDLTKDTEIPNYLSAHLFSGVQFRVKEKYSLFAEFRIGAVTNQDPFITVMEIALSALYWP